MPAPVIQPAFASGELAPSLYGRVDLAKFHAGAAMLRNFFIDYRGGASNRAGTSFVGPGFPGTNRLIPFQFSTEQTYMLVFGDHTMHVIMDGAIVVEPTPVLLSGLAALPVQGEHCSVLPAAPVWAEGDWIYLLPEYFGFPADGVMLRFAGRILKIGAVLAGPAYQLWDPFNEALLNGAPYGPGVSFVQRVFKLDTPYAAADLALLKFVQDADVMTLTHPDYPTQLLTRTDHHVWTITPASFAPTLPAPTAVNVVASGGAGTTTYRYVVTSVGGNAITESLPSAVGEALLAAAMSATPGVRMTVSWTYDPADDPPLFNVYRQAEVRDGAPAALQLFGFVGTVNADGSGAGSFVDQNIAPDFSRTPPIDPGLLSAVDQYPGCSTYYQQRQVFAGTNAAPQTLYASKTGDFFNMQYSSPSRPDDAIVATLVSKQVNAIQHLIAVDALLAFTSNAIWKIDAGANGGAITPSTIDANPQAYNGCSPVCPPIIVGRDALYVQLMGSAVRELAYNDFVKIYNGNDLSVLASHLFAGHTIVEWAYSEEPHKLIWCVREDGIALVFTYLKEQDVYAWTHAYTDGQFKSVASIPEGDENAVYYIVQRLYQGAYVPFIERLASRQLGEDPEFGVPADFTRFFFVDAGLSTALTYPAANAVPINGEAQDGGGWWVDPHIYAAMVIIGGAGYSATPTVVIEDPTGTGAEIVLTVLAGVVTAAVVVNKGENYTNPTVRIIDSTGAGAVVQAQLAREIEIAADAAVLAAVTVDSLFVGNGGYGNVLAVNSARSITVDMRQKLATNFPIPAGSWSVTPKVSRVSGLDHLEGREVSVLADGNVIEGRVVVDGAITLEQSAAKVVVGLPYTSRLESLYCDVPGEAPTVQGRKKQIPSVTVRAAETRGLKCGLKGEELQEFKERDQTALMGDPIPAYTGDRMVLTPASYDLKAQVVIEQQWPLPAKVLALIPNVTVGDTPTQ
jgi:hypothetical protein